MHTVTSNLVSKKTSVNFEVNTAAMRPESLGITSNDSLSLYNLAPLGPKHTFSTTESTDTFSSRL